MSSWAPLPTRVSVSIGRLSRRKQIAGGFLSSVFRPASGRTGPDVGFQRDRVQLLLSACLSLRDYGGSIFPSAVNKPGKMFAKNSVCEKTHSRRHGGMASPGSEMPHFVYLIMCMVDKIGYSAVKASEIFFICPCLSSIMRKKRFNLSHLRPKLESICQRGNCI